MPAFAAVLISEDCVPADPDRGLELLWLVLVASVVGVVLATNKLGLVGLPVFGIPYTGSISYYI
jgi:hypothetical protein